jgi:hypothetical protein
MFWKKKFAKLSISQNWKTKPWMRSSSRTKPNFKQQANGIHWNFSLKKWIKKRDPAAIRA